MLLSQLLSHSLPCYHSRLRSCSSLAKYLCDRLHRESQVYNNNIFQLQTQCFLFLLLLSQTNVEGLVQIFSFWNYFSFFNFFSGVGKIWRDCHAFSADEWFSLSYIEPSWQTAMKWQLGVKLVFSLVWRIWVVRSSQLGQGILGMNFFS